MANEQLSLTVIPHELDGSLVHQRAADGFINATAMCKAVGKLFGHYNALQSTKDFLEALSADIGIPISDLVLTIKGGKPELQGTWVHPDVAINLGQWCSPKFAVAVARWVREWMTGAVASRMPYHLRRYMANRSEIPHTHWSMLNEMTVLLIAPLESDGYTLPEEMLPDISSGKMFSSFLRKKKGIDTARLPTYRHRFADGRVVEARLYPNSVLAEFRAYFIEEWLPNQGPKYFEKRDAKALRFLRKILPSVTFKQLTD